MADDENLPIIGIDLDTNEVTKLEKDQPENLKIT